MKMLGLAPDAVKPEISPKLASFLAMIGKEFSCFHTETTPVRKGEPMKLTLTYGSDLPWLWARGTLDQDARDLKLGDQVWLDNTVWGTIIEIDDRTITLLFPGEKHDRRSKDNG